MASFLNIFVSETDLYHKGMKRYQKIGMSLVLAVLTVLPLARTTQAADVNNFTIQSLSADYYLSRDTERRSTMKVIEKIVAVFPQSNQNHGIERAIPEVYDDHSVGLVIKSVTNDTSQPQPYTTYTSNGNTVVRIGDANTYVHGPQTYILTYTLQKVTKNFDTHDEFFWDVNGTEWQQSFGSVAAHLHIDKSIKDAFDTQLKCYSGPAGSKDSTGCAINPRQTFAPTDDLVIDVISKRTLQTGENISMVVGFKPNTFAVTKPSKTTSVFEKYLALWSVLNVLVAIVMTIVLIRLWRRYGRAQAGRGTLVPEYLPPKDLSVISSATILKRPGAAVSAQIMDLAVRHYIRIIEQKEKQFFSTKTVYHIEWLKEGSDLRPEEQEVLKMLFGDKRVGATIALKDLSNKLYKDAAALTKANSKTLVTEGYYIDRAAMRRKTYWLGGVLIVVSIGTLTPVTFIAGIVALIMAASMWPLSEKGATARDYLNGLKMYMKLAETERIKTLQSPQGAAKTPVDTTDSTQLVHLYEKLLPYAVIFGIEKEWVKEFATLYQQPPEWYAGDWATFNAVVLASSIADFRSSAAASFASPTDSSSSGFSGGGVSGGGGGGGGGGGW